MNATTTTTERDEEEADEDACPECGATFGTFTGQNDLCMNCAS